MADASSRDVRILVKNVYAPSEAQQFVVVDSLLVRTLKEMLMAAMPGNPLPKHQKLIFGGKICDDDHTLARVLAGQNQNQSGSGADADGDETAPFVFHLMVSSAVPRSRPTTPVARAQPAPITTPTPPPTPTPVAAAQPPPATVDVDPIPPPAHPHAAPGFPFMGFFGAPPAAAAVPPANGATTSHGQHPLQQQHHQHLYTQAILMQQQAMILQQIQYLQQLQAHHAAHPAAAAAATQAPAQQPHGVFPQYVHFGHHYQPMYGMPHPAYGHGPPGAAAAPGFAGQQQPGGAAVAPAAGEPRQRGPIVEAFREILPMFDIRLAMKMAFMLFIIGQDTPTDRLIVLALMSFGAYLHITGILAKVFELVKRATGAQGGIADENADANDNNANDANGHAAPNPPGRLGAITRFVRISSDRGLAQDVRYFFVGLLLSLVPAWHPQPLNVDAAAPARPEPIVPDAGAELPLQGI